VCYTPPLTTEIQLVNDGCEGYMDGGMSCTVMLNNKGLVLPVGGGPGSRPARYATDSLHRRI
jgi:hypothetical protein